MIFTDGKEKTVSIFRIRRESLFSHRLHRLTQIYNKDAFLNNPSISIEGSVFMSCSSEKYISLREHGKKDEAGTANIQK